MARVFTVRSNNVNKGGFYCPVTLVRWRILFEDNGDLDFLEVTIPSSSCPKKWLDHQGIVLEKEALAERIS